MIRNIHEQILWIYNNKKTGDSELYTHDRPKLKFPHIHDYHVFLSTTKLHHKYG